MDDCQRTAARVTPYVDGVLPDRERPEVERHLAECPPCRRGAEAEQGGRSVLRRCATRLKAEPLPPGLRSRCEALAGEYARRGTRPWWSALAPLTGIAALVVFAGILLLALATRRSDALLAAQLTADHVKCAKVFLPDARAEAAAVERDLENKYGWEMHVPPSSAEAAVTLLGGRRCLYAEGPLPHVMYQSVDAGPVSLFRLEGVTRRASDIVTLGYRCRIWSRGGNTYVLVTPERQTPQMMQFARYVRAEAR